MKYLIIFGMMVLLAVGVYGIGTYPPLDPSMVLYYHFNNQSDYGENDSLVYDFSGNGNNGIMNNTIYNYTNGIENRSVMLNGNTSFISTTFSLNLSEASISLWIYPLNLTDNVRILQRGAGGRPAVYISNSRVYFNVYNGTTNYAFLSSDKITTNSWHHIVVEWGSLGMKLYLNGILNGWNSFTGYSQNITNPYVFGRSGSTDSSYFNGSIDEIIMYNKYLTENEIIQLYTNYKEDCNKQFNFIEKNVYINGSGNINLSCISNSLPDNIINNSVNNHYILYSNISINDSNLKFDMYNETLMLWSNISKQIFFLSNGIVNITKCNISSFNGKTYDTIENEVNTSRHVSYLYFSRIGSNNRGAYLYYNNINNLGYSTSDYYGVNLNLRPSSYIFYNNFTQTTVFTRFGHYNQIKHNYFKDTFHGNYTSMLYSSNSIDIDVQYNTFNNSRIRKYLNFDTELDAPLTTGMLELYGGANQGLGHYGNARCDVGNNYFINGDNGIVLMGNNSETYIHDNYIYNMTADGIRYEDNYVGNLTHRITSNMIQLTARNFPLQDGIHIFTYTTTMAESSNYYIYNNYFQFNRVDILLYSVNNTKVLNNDFLSPSLSSRGDISCNYCNNVTLEGNYFYNMNYAHQYQFATNYKLINNSYTSINYLYHYFYGYVSNYQIETQKFNYTIDYINGTNSDYSYNSTYPNPFYNETTDTFYNEIPVVFYINISYLSIPSLTGIFRSNTTITNTYLSMPLYPQQSVTIR